MNKLSVWNGDTINRIEDYLDQHFDALEDIVRAIRNAESSEEYTRRKGTVTLDGTGAATVNIPLPQGYDWILQRITATGAAAGTVQLYENIVAPTDLLEQIALPAVTFTYSDAFNNNLFIPGGSQLTIVFAGAGANAQGTYNLQIQQLKRKSHTHAPTSVRTGDY